MINTRQRRKHGFLLYELLVILILLAVLGTLLSQVIVMSLTAMRDSRVRISASQSIDSALAALRRDAWSAKTVSLDGPERLELTLPSGDKITWRVKREDDKKAVLSRQSASLQQWSSVPVTFEQHGPLLAVTVRSAAENTESLTLVSPLLIPHTGPMQK